MLCAVPVPAVSLDGNRVSVDGGRTVLDDTSWLVTYANATFVAELQQSKIDKSSA